MAVTGGFSGPHVWISNERNSFEPVTNPLLLETNPVNCVDARSGAIYVGCDVGVFVSPRTGAAPGPAPTPACPTSRSWTSRRRVRLFGIT